MAVTDDFQLAFDGLDLGDGTVYDLIAHRGFGMPGVRSADRTLSQRDGKHAGDDYLDERVIELTFEIDGTASAATVNTLTFQLPGYAGGGVRRVNVRPRRLDQPGTLEQSRGLSTVDMQVVATDPRMYADAESSSSTSLPSGGTGLSWPLTWPLNWGTITNSGLAVADNAGNYPAPVTIRVDGPVTNPSVENLTVGKTVELLLTVAAGDFVLIDPNERTVLLNGTASRYSALTAASEWWLLEPGVNEIRFQASTSTAATMTLTWRSAWIG